MEQHVLSLSVCKHVCLGMRLTVAKRKLIRMVVFFNQVFAVHDQGSRIEDQDAVQWSRFSVFGQITPAQITPAPCKPLVSGSRSSLSQDQGSRIKDQGSRIKFHGAWSRFKDWGSGRHHAQGSLCVENRQKAPWRTLVFGSHHKIKDQGSRIKVEFHSSNYGWKVGQNQGNLTFFEVPQIPTKVPKNDVKRWVFWVSDRNDCERRILF